MPSLPLIYEGPRTQLILLHNYHKKHLHVIASSCLGLSRLAKKGYLEFQDTLAEKWFCDDSGRGS